MLKFVPKLCEIHEKILEGVKNNKFEDKRIFCKENKSKLQFLIKENQKRLINNSQFVN